MQQLAEVLNDKEGMLAYKKTADHLGDLKHLDEMHWSEKTGDSHTSCLFHLTVA